mgnify:CR=1 FL=1
MPSESSSIPFPRDLLEAVHASVGPDASPDFVARAVAAALLRRRLFDGPGDPGVESWWPIEEMDFVMLSSGDAWLKNEDDAEE